MKNLITFLFVPVVLSSCAKKIELPNINSSSSAISVQSPAPVAESTAPAASAPSRPVTFSGASD